MSLSLKEYQSLYQQSLADPEAFWAEQAKNLHWDTPWQSVQRGDFNTLDMGWFTGGKLNACYNCLDRHLPHYRDKPAIIWEGNSPDKSEIITYGQLYERVCKFANVLKAEGVKPGDRVAIYLPMIPEIVVAMLACARIGAVHTVIFSGFSAHALSSRLQDAACSLVVTADEGFRAEKRIPLKQNCDEALRSNLSINRVIVVKHSEQVVPWTQGRDRWYHELMAESQIDCPPEPMEANQPLFILYTSGSTGKPKGVVHATGGYLVYVASTYRYVFDIRPSDVFWCTADPGWITGHSYLVYGPLANAATVVLFEGVPNYPSYARYWEIIDKHQVSIFYTSPTAIRALRKEGDAWLANTARTSLRLLGTVGEPINPEVWTWYFEVVGKGECPIVDTWWQTETGGMMITPMLGMEDLKPGSAARPFFGIAADIVDDKGVGLPANQAGKLVIRQAWPGLMQGIYGDKQRFASYFEDIPGCYLSGDGAHRDEDGFFWISGRNDDVIKVSGHRLGTGELESALLQHPKVAEAAVVGVPDELTGESIMAFITLKSQAEPSLQLQSELMQTVVDSIGAIARPKRILWAKALPKTRSGKIMRRILRKIASHDDENLGDLSTLAEPEVVQELIKGFHKM